MEGIDWTEIRKHLSNELKVVVRGVESATDRLLKDANAMDATYPEKWRTIIRSAAILARSALESTHKDGRWTNPTYLKKSLDDIFLLQLKQAVGWLSFLSDVMTVESLSHAVREVLEAILQHGPTKGDELATLAKGADVQDSTFREMLSEMVEDGLLNSGRGRYSTGY